MPSVKIQTQQQNIAFPQPASELPTGTVTAGSPQLVPAHRPKMPLPGEWAAQAARGACYRRGLEGGGAPGMSFARCYTVALQRPKMMSLLVCDFPGPHSFCC